MEPRRAAALKSGMRASAMVEKSASHTPSRPIRVRLVSAHALRARARHPGRLRGRTEFQTACGARQRRVHAGGIHAADGHHRFDAHSGRRGPALRRRPGHPRPVVDAVPITRAQRAHRSRAQAESDARICAGGAARGQRERGRRARSAVAESVGDVRGSAQPRHPGGLRSPRFRRLLLHAEQRQCQRVLHARRVRRHPPPDRGAAGPG